MKFKNTPIALALIAAVSTPYVFAAETSVNDNEEKSVERIEVTGSRIARINTQTASPVVSIDSSAIKASGILNINELLTQLPQFALGFDGSSGNSSFGNAGLNAVNLRNLGTDRTLVLVNGRRIVQSTYDSGKMVTDTGYIPVDLIDRVDILTGGAAATYGADAVAGVVNFVMKKEYEGTRISGQYGQSEIGDGEEASFTLTTGHNFNNDKGNIVVSLDYYDAGAASLMERPGSGEQTAWLNNPLNDGPDDDQPAKIAGYNLAWPDYNVHGQMAGIKDENGLINYYDVTGNEAAYMFNGDDQRSPYYMQEGDNARGWNINRYNKVQSPYDRGTFYTLLNYELTDTIQLMTDVRYTKVTSQNQISPQFNYWTGKLNDSWFDPSIERPAHVTDLLAQTGGNFYTSIGLNELGPRTSDVERELFAFTANITGEFSNDWLWDVYVSTGKSEHETQLSNYANEQRFGNNHDSITNDDGDYCGMDVFDCPGSHPLVPMSAEALNYIRLDPFGSQITSEQSVFSATLSGDIIELPYGDLMFAAGVDVRRESLDMKVDDVWQDEDIAGSEKIPWQADKTVKELFVEVEAPVLGDMFLIEQLVLTAAGRTSNYTYAGTHNTWKLGATWDIIDGLAMRSTYAHTIRSPQLNEQFTAASTGWSSNKSDPCDKTEIKNASAENKDQIIANCQSWGIADPENWTADTETNGGVNSTKMGNEALQPEKADTITVGLVYTPSFIDNLSITIDYYDIDLEDAMGTSGIQSTMDKCAKSKDTSTSIYCPLVVRGPDSNVTNVINTTVNQALNTRSGVDLEISYLLGLQSYGQLAFAFNSTKLLESTYQNTFESAEVDVNGIYANNAELKTRLVTTYQYESITASWTVNYAEGFQVDEDGTYDLYDKPFAPHSIMHDARFGVDVTDNANLYVGISNVFDKSYYNHPSTSYGRAQYDSMGRYFYGGFSYEF